MTSFPSSEETSDRPRGLRIEPPAALRATFEEFVAVEGLRLRRALVASFGIDLGNDLKRQRGHLPSRALWREGTTSFYASFTGFNTERDAMRLLSEMHTVDQPAWDRIFANHAGSTTTTP